MSDSHRSTIDFTLNGERVSLAGEDPARTVLTWLREERRLTGTKEGCAEGDFPANACILCVGAADREKHELRAQQQLAQIIEPTMPSSR